MSDRENVRKLTLLLDALDQERQDEAGRRKEYQARIEVLTTELLKLRDEIKNGQGALFSIDVSEKELFTESADGGKSPAAGEAVEAKAKAAAAGGTNANPTPPPPTAEDLDAHESDNEQRRRNSGDPA